MKYLLAQEHRKIVAQYAWSRVLIAFDFDGTLAPIVSDPLAAAMRPSTRARLALVADRYPTIVISGRSRVDVQSRLTGVPIHAVVGNHGLEPTEGMERYAALAKSWLPIVRRHMSHDSGVDIEDKRYSIAVHYRRSRAKRLALQALHAAVAELGAGVRWVGGKQVVNLVPEGAPHKGMALEMLRKSIGADTAVYVGDDLTDEDVFALNQPGRLLSIRIGRAANTRAPYYLRSQEEIDALLDELASLRATRDSHRHEDV